MPNATNIREALTSTEPNISSDERIVSVACGAALLFYGLAKHNAAGLLPILVSAMLLDRGVTGHCAISSILDRNTREPGEAAKRKAQTTYAITIDAPVAEIQGRLSDPEVLRALVSGGKVAEFPGETGFRMADSISRTGSMREYSASDSRQIEIGSRDAHTLEWRQPNMVCKAELNSAPGKRGTELRVTLRPERPLSLTRRLTAYFARKDVRRGLRQLKQELESGDVPTVVGQPSGRDGGRDVRDGLTTAEIVSQV
jgi:hypothetical protein